jgi:hypothetical protein
VTKAHDIQQHIRQAAASEVAAGRHEDRYAAQMKSAGASMYAGFCLALRASDEFQGRKIDDKAILRLYQSTKPRPWWDEHLKAAKFVDSKGHANRHAATRLIQWHVDPGAAEARHAQGKVQQLVAQKKLAKQRTTAARGMNSHEPTAREAQVLVQSAANSAHAGRELPPTEAPETTAEDLMGELNRLISSARKVKAGERTAVFEIVRAAARDIERYIA